MAKELVTQRFQQLYEIEQPAFTKLSNMVQAGEPITDPAFIKWGKLRIGEAIRPINEDDIGIIKYMLDGMLFSPYGQDKESYIDQTLHLLSGYPALVAKWGVLNAGAESARQINTVAMSPTGQCVHYIFDPKKHCDKLMEEVIQPVIDAFENAELEIELERQRAEH